MGKIVKSILLLFSIFTCSYGQERTMGLMMNSADSDDGFTLFAPSSSLSTYLIDNCGNEINSWESEYRPGAVAYLMENGSLLRTGRISGMFNAGGRGGIIEMISWDGDIEWQYTYADSLVHQHHDVELMPNGNVLILAWERISAEEARSMGRQGAIGDLGLWPDHVVEVQPDGLNDGIIVWEWHVKDHLIQDIDSSKVNYGVISEHPERININAFANSGGDWNHCNAVDYNPELDQIILSSRNFNEFWIIDHSTTIAESAGSTGGKAGKGGDLLYRWGNPISYNQGNVEDKKLYGQHDVHWIEAGLPNEGKIMIFNNGDTRGYSTVDIIEPPMDEDGHYLRASNTSYGPIDLFYSYDGNDLFSPRISGAQQMINGNILICEGFTGRFFEVDPVGNVVWFYQNPVSNNPQTQGDPVGNNGSFRVYRYPRTLSGFENKDLTPGLPVELGDNFYTCQIFGISSAEELGYESLNSNVYPNPVVDIMFVKNTQASRYKMMDMQSRLVSGVVTDGKITTASFGSGVYLLTLYDKQDKVIGREKIVKI